MISTGCCVRPCPSRVDKEQSWHGAGHSKSIREKILERGNCMVTTQCIQHLSPHVSGAGSAPKAISRSSSVMSASRMAIFWMESSGWSSSSGIRSSVVPVVTRVQG